MPMKVEAAVVTQKQTAAAFNTDSININGKTFPEEIIKNGYKGSGVVSGDVHFALASSKIEGFAGATVRAFEERSKKFPVTRDPRNTFSGFYEDCRSALINMKKQEDELVCACIYASGRTLTLAGNGNTGLYALRFGSCAPVVSERAENTVADYNVAVISDVSENDIYILLSPGAAGALSAKDIEDICKVSDGSVKRIVSLISKVALNNGAESAVTVIAVKVLETAAEEELSSAGFMPDFAAMEKMLYGENDDKQSEASKTAANIKNDDMTDNSADEESDNMQADAGSEDKETEDAEKETPDTQTEEPVVVPDDEVFVEKNDDSEAEEKEASADEDVESVDGEAVDEEMTDADSESNDGKSDKKTRIMLFSILGVMFAVSVVLIGLILVELFSDKFPGETTTVDATEETTVEETTEEETTEEITTEEETTEEEAATSNEEETTRKPQNNTQGSVTTTRAPQSTQAPAAQTTRAPETQTTQASSEQTTQASAEQTTQQGSAEQTTANAPEQTTAETPSETQAPATENQNAEAQQTDTAEQA